jgi:hypothetical protein
LGTDVDGYNGHSVSRVEKKEALLIHKDEFRRGVSRNALPVGIKISHSSLHSATPKKMPQAGKTTAIT